LSDTSKAEGEVMGQEWGVSSCCWAFVQLARNAAMALDDVLNLVAAAYQVQEERDARQTEQG